jgi:agmatine/peptidylarginine deiminase
MRLRRAPSSRVARRSIAAFACGLSLAACASSRAPAELPEPLLPPPGVRVPAEWEPAVGAVVTYPFEIPLELVAALAEEELLFVLVRTEDQQALRDELRANDLPRRKIQSIASAHGLPYTRDFGPHQIELPGGELAVLDQVFDGYPLYRWDADRGAADDEEWRFPARGADDRVAEACAAHFDLARYVVPFSLTGGNFLVDGRGTAFFTDALVDENLAWHAREEFFELLTRCTGATNLVHLPNIEGVGIQHVDCWIKVLPGNRLLVQRAPADHPTHARLEAAVAELESARDTSGAPFEILRIDCPVIEREALGDEAPLAAYTNALILNGRVHVPLYGVPGDEIALATWRAALPEHDVKGYVYADWQGFDALHCRTRAIFAGARRAQAEPEREPR